MSHTAHVVGPCGRRLRFSEATCRSKGTAKSKARVRFVNATGFSSSDYQRLGFVARITKSPNPS